MYAIDCVLVGLDWAEPMMNFLLHVTCSCIPHAYVLLIQYILIYLNWLGLFWMLFFSLLLFLFTLVVFMAPKRKSTPARNPLHSGASSSSDSAPLSLRFRDDDAHKAFSENFSRWGVHSERQVILADLADTNLPTVIHSREWESLSFCAYPRVLLQHAWDWLFSTSFLHSRLRYAHSCHIATCCECALGP